MKENLSPDQPVEAPAKPPRPWLKILPFLVLGAIFISALVFAGYKLGRKQINQTAQPTPTAGVIITSIPDLTVNWKTYTSQTDNFSFKYPQDWNVKNDNKLLVISEGNDSITFHTSPYPSIDFNKLYEKSNGTIDQNPVFIRTKIKNLEIDGHKATMYSTENAPTNQNKAYDISIYIIRGAPISMILVKVDPNQKSSFLLIFDQILSTFKFLD